MPILPSAAFGANAAWWAMVTLVFNVVALFKRLVLGPAWVNARMKRIRFCLLNLPGRVVTRARQVFIRLPYGHETFTWLLQLRQRILALAKPPP